MQFQAGPGFIFSFSVSSDVVQNILLCVTPDGVTKVAKQKDYLSHKD
jgi:hypothetical protein